MQSLEFDPAAFEGLAWWVQHDQRLALRIRLAQEAQRTPLVGISKPGTIATRSGGLLVQKN